jgi:hypothetical protein
MRKLSLVFDLLNTDKASGYKLPQILAKGIGGYLEFFANQGAARETTITGTGKAAEVRINQLSCAI